MTLFETVSEELERADLDNVAEIFLEEGRQYVVQKDGSRFFLDTLSNHAYWGYMSRREHAWYNMPGGEYTG